ncbi:unnamed protein product [Amoebophrya sp. A120]|nr:unnamed protein product [Amoebophrya sp. A120]|eukprot:GSA120T00008291001.1
MSSKLSRQLQLPVGAGAAGFPLSGNRVAVAHRVMQKESSSSTLTSSRSTPSSSHPSSARGPQYSQNAGGRMNHLPNIIRGEGSSGSHDMHGEGSNSIGCFDVGGDSQDIEIFLRSKSTNGSGGEVDHAENDDDDAISDLAERHEHEALPFNAKGSRRQKKRASVDSEGFAVFDKGFDHAQTKEFVDDYERGRRRRHRFSSTHSDGEESKHTAGLFAVLGAMKLKQPADTGAPEASRPNGFDSQMKSTSSAGVGLPSGVVVQQMDQQSLASANLQSGLTQSMKQDYGDAVGAAGSNTSFVLRPLSKEEEERRAKGFAMMTSSGHEVGPGLGLLADPRIVNKEALEKMQSMMSSRKGSTVEDMEQRMASAMNAPMEEDGESGSGGAEKKVRFSSSNHVAPPAREVETNVDDPSDLEDVSSERVKIRSQAEVIMSNLGSGLDMHEEHKQLEDVMTRRSRKSSTGSGADGNDFREDRSVRSRSQILDPTTPGSRLNNRSGRGMGSSTSSGGGSGGEMRGPGSTSGERPPSRTPSKNKADSIIRDNSSSVRGSSKFMEGEDPTVLAAGQHNKQGRSMRGSSMSSTRMESIRENEDDEDFNVESSAAKMRTNNRNVEDDLHPTSVEQREAQRQQRKRDFALGGLVGLDIGQALENVRHCFQENREILYGDLMSKPKENDLEMENSNNDPTKRRAERRFLNELEGLRVACSGFVATFVDSDEHVQGLNFLKNTTTLQEIVWTLEHATCFTEGDAKREDRLRMLHDRVKLLERRAGMLKTVHF